MFIGPPLLGLRLSCATLKAEVWSDGQLAGAEGIAIRIIIESRQFRTRPLPIAQAKAQRRLAQSHD